MSVPGVNITGPTAGYESILTPEALQFVAILHRTFEPTRQALLARRQEEQKRLDAGGTLDFPAETAAIRADKTWQGAGPGPGLADRRVEITGPVDRKMVINALNGGSTTYMADFEDSNAPTWSNNINGQVNLRDAVRRSITFKQGEKEYKLNEKIATLIVRPRGWHLDESHVTIDGQVVSGGIFDFALYFFHNAREAIARGFGPYFYLPKMEHYLEVRLWNDIFKLAQDYIGIPRGTIRATILIETIPAAFQMEEFIFEIKEHSAGLNCGRWDYIFSFIKKFRHNPAFVLPDRAEVTMTVPFMASYVKLLVQTCHTRGVAAMGGMSAQIPIKGDSAANDAAIAKVRSDKVREVTNGHDGTWVAHPALIPVALAIFNEHMPGPNQYYRRREDVVVSASELIDPAIPGAAITEKGIRDNISAALQYCANWASGNGCVPINHLMEDAATAEIARLQVWQWVRHGARTDAGKVVTAEWIDEILEQETAQAKATTAKGLDPVKVDVARRYLAAQIRAPNPDDFLTSGLTEDLLSTSTSKL